MKTAVYCAYYSNYQSLADLVLPNFQKYCDKHGYELFIDCLENLPDNEPLGNYKFKQVMDSFSSYRLVMCIDLDLLITNHTNKIESFIGTADYYVTKDVHGINTGSYIIRKSERIMEWMQFMIAQFNRFAHEQDAVKAFVEALEKASMIDLFNYPKLNGIGQGIKILPHPSINSYKYDAYTDDWADKVGEGVPMPTHEQGNWQPGDFILHLPGLSLAKRIEILSSPEIQNAIIYE